MTGTSRLATLALCILASVCLGTARAQTAPPYVEETQWWNLRRPGPGNFPDQQAFSALRFDKLEWGGPEMSRSARWDMETFVGTDYDKLFFKSEGLYDGKTRTTEEGQLQVLYSRLISYYFGFSDFRVDII